MPRLEKICFIALVVLLPTQLAYHFWPSWAFFSAIPVDYLSPTLFLTDLLILGLLLLSPNRPRLPIWLFPIVIINTLFSLSPWVTMFHWLKAFELIFFLQYLVRRPHLIHTLPSLLIIPIIWSAILAIFQFSHQGSINGPLYFLGERTFSITTSTIAASDFLGIRTLRPYATFPHPNVLAGFIVVGTLLILSTSLKPHLKFLSLLLTCLVLFFTISKSAIIALAICLLLPLLTNRGRSTLFIIFLMPLSVYLLATPSSQVRLQLMLESLKYSLPHLLTGTGLGTNVLTTSTSLSLQPIHNAYLIVLTELGLPLSFFLIYKFIRQFRNLLKISSLLAAFIISLFDHYWITQHQTLLLLTMLLAYFRLKFPQPNTVNHDTTSNKL